MDPRKLKVNELKEQLQLAGLSANGKKEELVARLLEHQKAEEDALHAGAGPATGSGDAFDWDAKLDDLAPPPPAGASTTTPAPAKPAAAPVTQTQQPETAPAASATSATTTPSTTASTAPSTTTTTVGDVKFQGGAVKDAETLKAEFEKRKNRAARFGIPLKEQDKAVERAARFGVPVTAAATASLAKATGTATSSTPSTTPAAGAKTLPTKPGSIAAGISADVLSKRQERFGMTAPVTKTAASSSTSTSAAVAPAKGPTAVKDLYALDAAEEEKKRKRAAKFGSPATAEDPSKKVKA